MTTDEKRKLGAGLCQLSPEDLNKALELVAQDNPSFQTTAEEVDLDMDAQVMFLCANQPPSTAPPSITHLLSCLTNHASCVRGCRARRPSGG